MIGREIKYEIPEISREQDPNQIVAQKQLERLAGLVPLEFGADIFDWLSRPEAPTSVSFPDDDPFQGSTLSNQVYTTRIYNYNIGGGAKAVTFIVGPSSNDDSDTYDYVTDGTNDDVQIQQAIDALPSTGGMVLLREGTYTINYTGAPEINSSKNGVHLQGMGRGTILQFENGISDDAQILWLSGAYCKVTGIYFNGNGANAAGGAGYGSSLITVGLYAEVSGCYFVNGRGGAIIADDYCNIHTNFFIDNDPSINATARWIVGVGIHSIVAENFFSQGASFVGLGTYYYIVDGGYSVISSNTLIFPSEFDAIGITLDFSSICIGNTLMEDGVGGDAGCTLITTNGSANIVSSNTITFAGNNEANGTIAIQVAGDSAVVGNYISGINGRGILADGGYNQICANRLFQIATTGIDVGYERNTVTGNTIQGCGMATDNTYSGIKLTSTDSDYNVITNNVITGITAGNDLKYCIEEVTGCDYNIIEHNVATGADTAQINIVGANTISANNIIT